MNITVKLKAGGVKFITVEQALALQAAIDHPSNASPELRTSAEKVEKIYLGKWYSEQGNEPPQSLKLSYKDD